MKLISDGNKLDKTLVKLINKHQFTRFAVAWASPNTRSMKYLLIEK